jgi:hypothetical protein
MSAALALLRDEAGDAATKAAACAVAGRLCGDFGTASHRGSCSQALSDARACVFAVNSFDTVEDLARLTMNVLAKHSNDSALVRRAGHMLTVVLSVSGAAVARA